MLLALMAACVACTKSTCENGYCEHGYWCDESKKCTISKTNLCDGFVSEPENCLSQPQ